ncbi:serine hydrolase [Nocardioides gansuensis]|uniref:Serine hydrolase n=1 Tax=Nocardioides gansuensis TaxID=2138300 RepID=A0A2T8F763_9ACTN|nr:serine hydrolase domain-containing protein [Nocardioides gansuensis]PVG81507.1 serine hydrolase [Nocardioides gansuensis]
MAAALPRSTPVEQQVDPAAVLDFIDAVDTDPTIELHSVMVLRHGHVVAEGWWSPHTPERPRLLYSLSKSFTTTALGLALAEGLCRLDDEVVSYFPELDAEITDPRSRAMTLRHLAAMASGHNRDMLHDAVTRDPQDPVRGFLLIPPDAEPGTLFSYSQPCTYTIAAVIQRVAGMPLTAYLRPRLFDPLGIEEVSWQSWPPERELGFSGLFARTEDVAKLGQLYLQHGRWQGRQLLPEDYVAMATSRHVDSSPGQDNIDWQQGYGYQFWMSRHGYRGDGAFGQFCLVLPDQDTVVAMTGGTEAMQTVLNHFWQRLLPGLETGTPDNATEDQLARRLHRLHLPPCAALPSPPSWAAGTNEPFPVAEAAGLPASTLTSVRLARAGPGWEVTITEPDNELTFAAGATDWLVSEPRDRHGDVVPVAASGGWLDDHTLRIELIFLESPHRLDIACSLPSRTAEAAWRGVPLDGGRLQTLRRPAHRDQHCPT